MKIVIANNFYYLRGGAERVLFEEKQLLQENGHQVIVFSGAHPSNDQAQYANYFLPSIDYEEIKDLPLLRKIPIALNIIYNKRVGIAFSEFLEESHPDLVHAHNIYGGLTTSILDAAQRKSVPVVMTLHAYKLVCPSYLMLNRGKICEDCKGGKFIHCLYNRCHKESLSASLIYTIESYYNKWFKKYENAAYFICPSHFLFRKIQESGYDQRKLVHVSNFVNCAKFTPSFNGDYVLFVGRLSKEKGLITLLAAMKNLPIPLRIVGDGPVRLEAESFVNDNNMRHVSFEGYQSGESLKSLFQRCSFLVIPSECYENAPMSILEAFAYGKPVLGSALGGIPEMVIDGQTGRLFKQSYIEDLRDKLVGMWENEGKLVEMGKAARNRVETEYSSEYHFERLIAVYKQILK